MKIDNIKKNTENTKFQIFDESGYMVKMKCQYDDVIVKYVDGSQRYIDDSQRYIDDYLDSNFYERVLGAIRCCRYRKKWIKEDIPWNTNECIKYYPPKMDVNDRYMVDGIAIIDVVEALPRDKYESLVKYHDRYKYYLLDGYYVYFSNGFAVLVYHYCGNYQARIVHQPLTLEGIWEPKIKADDFAESRIWCNVILAYRLQEQKRIEKL